MDSYPESIALTISERCNFRCITCCQQHRPEADLSHAAVERLREILPYVRTVSITGGEPLLHPSLDRLLGLAQMAENSTIVLTNGSLITAEKSAYLVDKQVTFLKISCDGASARTYNTIRKGGDFFRLVGNIAGLTKRKIDLGSILPVLEFNFVAMRSTIGELPRLIVLAGELGVEVVNVLPLRADNLVLGPGVPVFLPKRRRRNAGSGLCHGRKNRGANDCPTAFCLDRGPKWLREQFLRRALQRRDHQR